MTTEAHDRLVPRRRPRPTTTRGSPLLRALADLWEGLLAFRFWGVLGWSEIRQQYKRSTFGPLWITLSMAIFISLLGVLYAQLFQRDLASYIPHLAIGYIIWNVISGFIESGTRTFINAEGIIKQLAAPLSVHAYRIAWVSLITLTHHSVIIAAVLAIFTVPPTAQWALVLPGLTLIFLTGIWVCLLLGMICTRFRDVPQIVQSVMRVLFFLTPVIWQADLMPRRAVFLTANPIYHYIELIRAPLLNKPIDWLHWFIAGAITALGWIVTIAVYRRFRQRVAYWL